MLFDKKAVHHRITSSLSLSISSAYTNKGFKLLEQQQRVH